MLNNSKRKWIKFAFLFLGLWSLIFFQCKNDVKSTVQTLKIRLAGEPDCLHPVVSQSAIATQIEVLMLPPLFEYSFEDLELSPILIKELTEPVQLNDSTLSYNYEILQEAQWEDNKPVTAHDVAYTIKSSLNPHLKNKTYTGFFKNVRDVITDPENPKKISILVSKNYMLHKEMSGNYSIYPEHVYDSALTMRNFTIPDLLVKDSASWGLEKWSELKNYASIYQSKEFCRNRIVGCGPYKLQSWQEGTKIILEKTKNWWGDTMGSRYPFLKAFPDKIEYWIIPEEASALIELEKGNIDIMSEITPRQFIDLKNKSNTKLKFATPSIFQYNYVEINHRNPILADVKVREALAGLIDIKAFIKDQYFDLASPISSPVHPSRPYFNSDLSPFEYNSQKSIDILKESGWSDSDSDGILDKIIQGKKQFLELRFLIPNREVSKKFGILFQEEAKKAGIKLNIEIREDKALIADLNALNFDLAMFAQRQSPSPWDPYQSWSSRNTQPGGFNKSGYATKYTDSLIQVIRSTEDGNTRINLYKLLQSDLRNNVAQLFLFAPQERIAYKSSLNVLTSSRRPGYYEAWVH